jgi:hypothetical protein
MSQNIGFQFLKVFIVVLIIIVLITVVIGGIFIWQYSVLQNNPTNSLPALNQQATEDWKTYTNTEYGFEFKYPENYFLHINPGPAQISPMSVLIQEEHILFDAKVAGGNFGLYVSLIFGDVEGFIKGEIEYRKQFELPLPEFKKIMIGEIEAYRYKSVWHNAVDISESDNVIISQRNKGIIRLRLFRTQEIDPAKEILSKDDIALFDKIISTLNFTK